MAREKGKSIKENDLIMLTVIGQTVKNLKLKKGEIILKWAPVGCAMVRRGQRQIQQRPSVATLWLLIVKSTAHCSRAQNCVFARWDLIGGTCFVVLGGTRPSPTNLVYLERYLSEYLNLRVDLRTRVK